MQGFPKNKTKIVGTLGPSSSSVEVITKMIKAGLNVARINFSHGDPTVHNVLVENVHKAEEIAGSKIAIMADLPGPKMRIGELSTDFILLEKGKTINLTAEKIVGDVNRVYVSFSKLVECVKPGDKLFLNDGSIELVVRDIVNRDVICEILVGGELRPRKGLNIPDINLGISAFTAHDFECLKFAASHKITAISQSFVESADDIKAVRKAAESIDYEPFIIAKIERSKALDNIEEILEVADGLMVARGDLGVEIPIEQISLVQKRLIRLANIAGKPVITATQMLESMVSCNRPTRAEACDVSNAILDGTDCVMLSAESAAGQFPVESVEMLARIAGAVEPEFSEHSRSELIAGVADSEASSIFDFLALSAEGAVTRLEASAIFAPSRTGETVRKIARFHLPEWIVAISKNLDTCLNLQFSYGVIAENLENDPEDWTEFVRSWSQEKGISGSYAIIVQGPSFKYPDRNHRLEIVRI